jgi:flagellar biosynthesis protein FlhF
LDELRRQMDRMTGTLVRNHYLAGTGVWRSPELAKVLEDLLQAGFAAGLVQDLAARLEHNGELSLADRGTLRRAVRQQLEEMFRVDSRIGADSGGKRVVALVGPPGSGKTTTLVKLAATYGLRSRKPIQILSVDTWRIGGAEQLRSYAAILGVGCQALDTMGGLAQALEEHRQKNLVLIDTPGQSERDMDASDELAAFLQSHPEIDVHLTLTASMKSADLTRAVGRFERFRPAKLIFTRLDETASLGTVLGGTNSQRSFLPGQRSADTRRPGGSQQADHPGSDFRP